MESFRGQMLTPLFVKIRLFEPQQVRERRADALKKHVPVRRLVYRRLLSEFNSAEQKGLTLRQLADDWGARAEIDPEAALLLRDLWEVSNITEAKLAEHNAPDANTKALMASTGRLLRQPFDGEEVLF
jgi:hypothetical protein